MNISANEGAKIQLTGCYDCDKLEEKTSLPSDGKLACSGRVGGAVVH